MKLTVLHLSDIHIRGASDLIFNFPREIAAASFGAARESDACIILVTGDIAYGGQKGEYKAAERLLRSIRSALVAERVAIVDIIVAPGNHDCALLPINNARVALIQQIVSEPEFAADGTFIETCTKPQDAFFHFQKTITQTKPTVAHKLWMEYELAVRGKVVRFSAINAAWMSRIPEKQGDLIFPLELFQEIIAQPCSLRIALLHHPLNWYAQSTYHPLRKGLRSHANVVLSGHEHLTASGATNDALVGENLVFEAAALQPDTKDEAAGFSVLKIDLEESSILEWRYKIIANKISQPGDPIPHSLNPARGQDATREITDEFQRYLRDPGGNFKHPEKVNIEIDDLFVYPELLTISDEQREEPSIQADVVFSKNHVGERILLIGDDKAGKSTLLLRGFRDFHRRGLLPLFMKGYEFSSSSTLELDKRIQKNAGDQYVTHDTFTRAPKEKRIALLDDADRVPGGPKTLHRLMSYLETHFSAVILSASSGFEFAELVDKDTANALKTYRSYEIQRFGYKLRRQLIKKWCLCGTVSTVQELDVRVHAVEELLNSVVGRNLVPPRPFFLLILLHSHQQREHGDIQNSSFAHYYHYLITKSLQELGVKREHLNELFNYLSELAWFYRVLDMREATLAQLRTFNAEFDRRFVAVDLGERLKLLCEAKILLKRGDQYSFAYPYIYYFFVGKYLGDNLDKNDIQETVSDWCANLHKRENSYALLFLTHHRSSSWLIEQMVKVLKGCFADDKPMKFDGDVSAINKLIDSTMELFVDDLDVDRNQEQARFDQEKVEEREDIEEAKRKDIHASFAFIDRIHLLLRTAEILGQILKNYYGSLERPVKAELMREVFDAPLRLLRAGIEGIASEPENLVIELETVIDSKRPGLRADRKKEVARHVCFQILGMISTGAIIHAAKFVNTDKLDDDIRNVIAANPTTAYRLVGAATRLMRPGRIPIDEIRKLSAELKSNVFAFTILQSLAGVHLHLFHTGDSEKQGLCEHLNISMATSRAIDIKNKRMKLLAAPK